MLTYPLGWYKNNGKHCFMTVSCLQGDEKNTKRFVADLRKDKRIKKAEIVGNVLFLLTAETPQKGFYYPVYERTLIFPRPVVIKDGYEYWEIASWDRKPLEVIVKGLESWGESVPEYRIEKMARTKLNNIFIPHLMPKLSMMQKNAFELACKSGYYMHPKKTDIKMLANKMRISAPTFHEHLRKAESKLMPFLGEKSFETNDKNNYL